MAFFAIKDDKFFLDNEADVGWQNGAQHGLDGGIAAVYAYA